LILARHHKEPGVLHNLNPDPWVQGFHQLFLQLEHCCFHALDIFHHGVPVLQLVAEVGDVGADLLAVDLAWILRLQFQMREFPGAFHKFKLFVSGGFELAVKFVAIVLNLDGPVFVFASAQLVDAQ